MQVQQLLQQAGAAFSQGNLLVAEQVSQQILTRLPHEPNTHHLMALVRKRQGRLADAEAHFGKALVGQPDNPQILSNFGNLLKDLGRFEEAIDQYQRAVAKHPGFADAYFNLGLAFQAEGDFSSAIEPLSEACRLKPTDPRYANALGVSFKELDQLDEAIACYGRALAAKPDHFRALHNMGVALRMQDRQQEALDYYRKAMEIDPRVPELRYNLGNALYELGEYQEADEQYRTAIGLRPDYLEAHETLNQMYWEHGQTDLFARSYEVAIKSAPESPLLREAQVKALELSGAAEEAEAVLDEALATLGPHAGLLRRKARLTASRGDLETGVDYFHKAIDEDPGSQPIRIDAARLLIPMGRYQTALDHLDVAEKLNPFDQEMWAYRGLCWKFLDDPREAWLNNYDAFVQPQKIGVPDGYGSLEEFVAELSAAVTEMHVTQVRPLEQTLVGGTQTHGKLFFRPVPIVQTLRKQLEICIHRYIDSLPNDPDHPLLSRKSSAFRFAGSWSVRLTKDGFHVNHVHPAGWISSAFYVDVPPSLLDDDPAHAGWIKFGESGLGLGEEREDIRKLIRPEPGLLALFPSYVWHGTVPFTDDAVRMTTPFDVVPD